MNFCAFLAPLAGPFACFSFGFCMVVLLKPLKRLKPSGKRESKGRHICAFLHLPSISKRLSHAPHTLSQCQFLTGTLSGFIKPYCRCSSILGFLFLPFFTTQSDSKTNKFIFKRFKRDSEESHRCVGSQGRLRGCLISH